MGAAAHRLFPHSHHHRGFHAADAPDAGRPRRSRQSDDVRQEQGATALGRPDQDDLRGRRRGGRSERGRAGASGVPVRSEQVSTPRRPHSPRHADGGFARHRQDAARQGHRRRSEGAFLLHLRVGFRGDVRGRRRFAGARHVRTGQEAGALHHLHRRDRRGGPAPRRRPWRRPRRARADLEPAARGNGRFRGQRRHHRDRRHQSPGRA